MVVHMKELTRAKQAGECDYEDEYAVHKAQDVMLYFDGDRGPPCDSESKADRLMEMTYGLCKKWGSLSRKEEDALIKEEKELAKAYAEAAKIVKGYIDRNVEMRGEDESESSSSSSSSSSEGDDEDEAATSERSNESENSDGEEDEGPASPARKRQRLP